MRQIPCWRPSKVETWVRFAPCICQWRFSIYRNVSCTLLVQEGWGEVSGLKGPSNAQRHWFPYSLLSLLWNLWTHLRRVLLPFRFTSVSIQRSAVPWGDDCLLGRPLFCVCVPSALRRWLPSGWRYVSWTLSTPYANKPLLNHLISCQQ